MATKPSSVPTWNTSGDNNTEPSSGQKALGFVVGQQPPSSYFNWWMGLVYQWCAYLSDGALSGAITMASTLGVTGAVTFASTLGVTGAVTMAATLAVTGAVTLSSTLSVTGLITATAGITAGSNAHVTVSGTGEFKHGDRVKTVAGASMVIEAGTGWAVSGITAVSTSNVNGFYCIPFNTGDRIKSITAAFFGNGVSDITFSAFTADSPNPTSTTSIGTANVVNTPASWTDSTLDVTDTTLGTGKVLIISIGPNASGISVGNVRVTWDRP